MKTSQKGLEFIAEQEGCILHIYKDVAGYETIGIGHLLTADEKKLQKIKIGGEFISSPITKEQALQLLSQDVKMAENAVNQYVKVSLDQNQFDALVSFTFNCGSGALQKSSLLTELNKGNYSVVPDKLNLWNKAGGKICDALVKRRKAEGDLWQA